MKYKKEKLVSVIVPVYNSKLYLRECLNSITNQDYNNLQIIVVDDGSTDGSGEICDEYAVYDKRIEVIHIKNGGSVKARKQGLKKATGYYIGFVDSDDYLASSMFSTLVRTMEETNADFVHSGYIKVKGKEKSEYINFKKELIDLKGRNDYKKFIREYLLDIKSGKTISYSIWSKLYKKELITQCFNQLNDSIQFGEDAICLFRCVFRSRKITFLPEALYYYRFRTESLSHADAKNTFLRQVIMCSEIIQILSEKSLTEELCGDVYEYLLSSLLPIIRSDVNQRLRLRQYYLASINFLKGKKIVVYGAGEVGKDVYEQLKHENIHIAGIVDKNRFGEMMDDFQIIKPSEIRRIEYDYILIAILRESIANEIRNELARRELDREKIIWIRIERYF